MSMLCDIEIIGGGTTDDVHVVCMYDHNLQQRMDQPGKVTKPARGQLNGENEVFFMQMMHP